MATRKTRIVRPATDAPDSFVAIELSIDVCYGFRRRDLGADDDGNWRVGSKEG